MVSRRLGLLVTLSGLLPSQGVRAAPGLPGLFPLMALSACHAPSADMGTVSFEPFTLPFNGTGQVDIVEGGTVCVGLKETSDEDEAPTLVRADVVRRGPGVRGIGPRNVAHHGAGSACGGEECGGRGAGAPGARPLCGLSIGSCGVVGIGDAGSGIRWIVPPAGAGYRVRQGIARSIPNGGAGSYSAAADGGAADQLLQRAMRDR
jgi:hypothetical protein